MSVLHRLQGLIFLCAIWLANIETDVKIVYLVHIHSRGESLFELQYQLDELSLITHIRFEIP